MDRESNQVYVDRDPFTANEGNPFVGVPIDRHIVEEVADTFGLERDKLARALREIGQAIDVGALFSGFDPTPIGTDENGHVFLRAEAATFWDALADQHGLTPIGREAAMTAHDEQVDERTSDTHVDWGVGILVSCPEFPANVVPHIHTLVEETPLTSRQATVWALHHRSLSASAIADILDISTLLVESELSAVDRETRRISEASQILDSPAREITRLNPEPTSPDWLGLSWSPWLELKDRETLLNQLPEDSGVYRVRHTGWPGILYIGESGATGGLRERVGRGLAFGLDDNEPPRGGTHNATKALWYVDEACRGSLKVSVATPPSAANTRYRRALEATLVAVARREMGRTPDVMLNRNPVADRKGAEKISDEDPPLKDKSLAIPSWESWRMVTSSDWMGFEWTEPRPLRERGQLTKIGTCVVRVWEPTDDEENHDQYLTLVGTSETPISRLFSLQNTYGPEMYFSVAELAELSSGDLDRSRELEEARYDLIGAHYLATGQPPRDQY